MIHNETLYCDEKEEWRGNYRLWIYLIDNFQTISWWISNWQWSNNIVKNTWLTLLKQSQLHSCLKVRLHFTRDKGFYYTTVFAPGGSSLRRQKQRKRKNKNKYQGPYYTTAFAPCGDTITHHHFEDKNKYKNKNKEKTKTNTKGSTAPQSLLQVEIKSLIITSWPFEEPSLFTITTSWPFKDSELWQSSSIIELLKSLNFLQ